MPAGDYDDAPRVRSWITPKAAKGGASAIEGRGVHAVEVIPAGEVVAVKGGHIVDGSAVAGLPGAIRDSAFPIAADCFLAALTPGEYDGVMMRVNHSCEPNVGMGGNVLLVSMRDIAAGEELTIDYALFLGESWLRYGLPVRDRGLPGVVRGRIGGAPTCGSATRDGFPGGSSRRSRKPGTTRADSP
jgi:hypothetical protein